MGSNGDLLPIEIWKATEVTLYQQNHHLPHRDGRSRLLAPLRFPDPGNLYLVRSHAPSLGDAPRAASGPDFRDFRDQGTTLSEIAAAIGYFSELWTGDGIPRVLKCTGPTPQFFSVMGIRPTLGRLYTAKEYSVLSTTSVLISEKFWKEQLGFDPHVIGRRIIIGGATQSIVGVLVGNTSSI